MPRQPLIAGNWKMNLNHLEAIALVQKLAFALPEKYFAKVEVAVLVPFTALRSVQALIEGDKLLVGYGAQDLSAKDAGAYTGDVSGPMLSKLTAATSLWGIPSGANTTVRTMASWPARCGLRCATG